MEAVATQPRIGVTHALRAAWPVLARPWAALGVALARVVIGCALIAALLVVVPDALTLPVALVLLVPWFALSALGQAALLAVIGGGAVPPPRDLAAWAVVRARARGRSGWASSDMFALAVLVRDGGGLDAARARSEAIYRARWETRGLRGGAPAAFALKGAGLALLAGYGGLAAGSEALAAALALLVLVGACTGAALARALLTLGAAGVDVGLTAAEQDRLLGPQAR